MTEQKPLEDDLREQVFLALGEASMCWSETPQGTFDDQRASEIGKKLIQAIERQKTASVVKGLLDNPAVDSLFDQVRLAKMVAQLADHVQRIETEVLSEGQMQSNPNRERQTLRGRVNELSAMAALSQLSHPWDN